MFCQSLLKRGALFLVEVQDDGACSFQPLSLVTIGWQVTPLPRRQGRQLFVRVDFAGHAGLLDFKASFESFNANSGYQRSKWVCSPRAQQTPLFIIL